MRKVHKDQEDAIERLLSDGRMPGELSLEEAQELIDDPLLSDEEMKAIQEEARRVIEVIYEKWLQDRKKQQDPPAR